MEPLMSEMNIWKVKDVKSGRVEALVVVYIDDLLILGEEEARREVVEELRRIWETSSPEEVDDHQGCRFLGMELWRDQEGNWMATQRGYTLDLLQRNLGGTPEEWKRKRTPMTKDWVESPEEEQKDPRDIKEAQRVVGELMWLMIRTRIDLLFVMATLASNILKKPRAVKEAAAHVWAYLVHTLEDGIVFPRHSEDEGLQSFTDASFGEER